jgi:ATP-dependent Clp protease ATP-binding subunit ClpA
MPVPSDALLGTLLSARVLASQYGADEILPEYLILGVFSDPPLMETKELPIKSVLQVSSSLVEELFERLLGTAPKQAGPAKFGDMSLSRGSQDLIESAISLAEMRGTEAAGPLHLILAAIVNGGSLSEALKHAGLTEILIERVLP